MPRKSSKKVTTVETTSVDIQQDAPTEVTTDEVAQPTYEDLVANLKEFLKEKSDSAERTDYAGDKYAVKAIQEFLDKYVA